MAKVKTLTQEELNERAWHVLGLFSECYALSQFVRLSYVCNRCPGTANPYQETFEAVAGDEAAWKAYQAGWRCAPPLPDEPGIPEGVLCPACARRAAGKKRSAK
jgi:hypothetical protein